MKPTAPDALPPILFSGARGADAKRLGELKRSGRIRSIGPRLFVSVRDDQIEQTLRDGWAFVVRTLFPRALISHRTALEFRPSETGEVFITASTNRDVHYPGLSLRFVRGPEPLADDPHFLGIRVSSLARAFLENLASRAGMRPRSVSREILEGRLEQILHTGGEAELNTLRDRAKQIAEQLAWRKEGDELDRLIGALLGTRDGKLESAVAKARALGEPFDAARVERFSLLFGQLRDPLSDVRDTFTAPDHARNKAFFEAYFSNYIEGTKFEIEQAEEIVFDKQIPKTRPADAHDILSTFDVVSDPDEMRRTPETFDGFLDLLRHRHAAIMASRPEMQPGVFKTRINRAGDTEFVHPDNVLGTLRKGFEIYQGVRRGLPRAIFIMFLTSEIHPFSDGNGRTARIMMNAELAAEGLSTIIIPTVFRDDYVRALQALSRRDRPQPLVNALWKAHRFSHREFSPYPDVLKELTRRNWFREPDDARLID